MCDLKLKGKHKQQDAAWLWYPVMIIKHAWVDK